MAVHARKCRRIKFVSVSHFHFIDSTSQRAKTLRTTPWFVCLKEKFSLHISYGANMLAACWGRRRPIRSVIFGGDLFLPFFAPSCSLSIGVLFVRCFKFQRSSSIKSGSKRRGKNVVTQAVFQWQYRRWHCPVYKRSEPAFIWSPAGLHMVATQMATGETPLRRRFATLLHFWCTKAWTNYQKLAITGARFSCSTAALHEIWFHPTSGTKHFFQTWKLLIIPTNDFLRNVRHLSDHIKTKCRKLFTPGRYVALDMHMIKSKALFFSNSICFNEFALCDSRAARWSLSTLTCTRNCCWWCRPYTWSSSLFITIHLRC